MDSGPAIRMTKKPRNSCPDQGEFEIEKEFHHFLPSESPRAQINTLYIKNAVATVFRGKWAIAFTG
jgi:hypothetical protein